MNITSGQAESFALHSMRADTQTAEAFVTYVSTHGADGWTLMGVVMSTEDNLAEIAHAFGIDRMNESSFDSGDFPKVIFASQVEDDEYCGKCDRSLI